MRAIVRFGLKLYFKNIFVAGLNRIPKEGAIMISSNHPSAFFEPILLACLADRPIYFLTRGDIFKKPWANKILRALHMIPIYRFRDGHENMKKNQETFQTCYQRISEGEAIQIFSEGHNSTGIGLDKLQKGTAKIAFGALNYNPKVDLKIFPVTFYYSDKNKFRGDAFLNCGKPILINEYNSLLQSDENQAIINLTNHLQDRMSEKVVAIHAGRFKEMLLTTLKMYRNEFAIQRNPAVVQDRQLFHQSIQICNNFYKLPEQQQEELYQKFHHLSHSAKTKKIDLTLAVNPVDSTKYYLISLLGLAPLVLSATNLLPVLFGRKIAQKLVKDDDFFGPVQFGVAYFSWLILFLLSLIAGLFCFSSYFLLYTILLPFLGIYAIYFVEYIRSQRNSKAMDDSYILARKKYLQEIDKLIP